MRHGIWAAVLAAFAVGGLIAVGLLHVVHRMPIVADLGPYVSGGQEGAKACLALTKDFQQESSKWSILAWIAAVAGTVLTTTGGILGAGAKEDPWYRRGAGVLLASLGASLAAGSAVSVSRSNAASTAASAAVLAVTETKDEERYFQCARAKAAWLQSRPDSLDQTPPPQHRESDGQGITPSSKGTSSRSAGSASTRPRRPGPVVGVTPRADVDLEVVSRPRP
jgi:hypothetical protein